MNTMTSLTRHRHRQPPRRQRGASLWIVTVLTVILGLLAASQSTSVMSLFRGARNTRDLALARQAAEAALRDAEADITCQQWDPITHQLKSVVAPDTPNSYCISQAPVCAQLMPTADAPGIRVLGRNPQVAPAAVNWTTAPAACLDGSCAIEYGRKTLAPSLSAMGIAQAPRYQVDVVDVAETGDNEPSPLFRISVRGYGATASTVVDLQEVYRPCK